MRHLLPFQYIDAIARSGSIRKAAERLSITPSALNRRLLSMEDELGVEIFERLPAGVRLNVAGEILLEHIRNQISDMERVKSRIADLSGIRRGTVSIVCTGEVIGQFLSEQVEHYRIAHPGVIFRIEQQPRGAAENILNDHSADIAMVFEPLKLTNFHILHTSKQPIVALMSKSHPLAHNAKIRLYECLEYPLLLPDTTSGIRHLLETAASRLGIVLEAAVQSNSQEFLWHQMSTENHISFRIPFNLPTNLAGQGLVARTLDDKGTAEGHLFVGQLRGRTLPVAPARFIEQMIGALASEFA